MTTNQLRSLVRISVVPAIAMLVGFAVGMHFNPQAARAADAGKVVSFNAAINGKLLSIPEVPAVRFSLIATENGADFSATQIDGVVKRHRHDHSAEFFYVVSGSGTVTIAGLTKAIAPGDMLAIPKGVPHAIASVGGALHLVEVDVPSIGGNDTHWMP